MRRNQNIMSGDARAVSGPVIASLIFGQRQTLIIFPLSDLLDAPIVTGAGICSLRQIPEWAFGIRFHKTGKHFMRLVPCLRAPAYGGVAVAEFPVIPVTVVAPHQTSRLTRLRHFVAHHFILSRL